MKKNVFYFTLLCISVLLFACNGKEDKKGDETKSAEEKTVVYKHTAIPEKCRNVPGMGNLIITTDEAQAIIKNFERNISTITYGNDVNPPTKSFWIDACTVDAIAKYLDTLTNADGLRIYLCAYRPGNYKTSIYFIPTTSDGSPHKDIRTPSVPLGNCTGFREYFINRASNNDEILAFDEIYRLNPGHLPTAPASRDHLSKGVWVHKCVWDELNQLLKDNAEFNIDGVNIKMGAYLTNDPATHPGQLYINQTTFILVPTQNGVDNFDVVNSGFKASIFGGGAYNHGALCPQVCN